MAKLLGRHLPEHRQTHPRRVDLLQPSYTTGGGRPRMPQDRLHPPDPHSALHDPVIHTTLPVLQYFTIYRPHPARLCTLPGVTSVPHSSCEARHLPLTLTALLGDEHPNVVDMLMTFLTETNLISKL